jgi:hypothetical protein
VRIAFASKQGNEILLLRGHRLRAIESNSLKLNTVSIRRVGCCREVSPRFREMKLKEYLSHREFPSSRASPARSASETFANAHALVQRCVEGAVNRAALSTLTAGLVI